MYWPPLYAFLRRSGNSPEASKDLVQGYLSRLVARASLGEVFQTKGRFRSYLIAGLKNYLVSEIRRETAQKRGGPDFLAVDLAEAEAGYAAALADNCPPDFALDRRWAETIIARAMTRLREEYAGRGRTRLFEVLKPTLTEETDQDYAALAGELDLKPGAVGVAVHRLRLRFRELVRAEVAQTVGSEADLEEEMRTLYDVLSR